MSVLVIYFGFRADPARDGNLRHHNVILGPRYTELLRELFDRRVLGVDFSQYLHVPTLTDPSLAPPGHHAAYTLVPVPHNGSGIDWSVEGPRLVDRVITFLDERGHIAGLRERITVQSFVTPDYFESTLNSRLGNAFGVLLTTKGAPLIYYGDEVGLPGAGDPDNRRMMQWSNLSTAQQALHDRIAALTHIRAAHPALRRGTRTTLTVTEDLWVFEVSTAPGDPTPDTVYVGINRNDTDLTSTMIPSGLPELITNATSSGTVTIPARETRIWANAAAGDAGP